MSGNAAVHFSSRGFGVGSGVVLPIDAGSVSSVAQLSRKPDQLRDRSGASWLKVWSDCLHPPASSRSASAAWSWKTVSRARSIHRRAVGGIVPPVLDIVVYASAYVAR